jgi:hypothetical protein
VADGRTLICPSAPLASSLSSRGLGHGGDGRAGFLLPARLSSLQQRCRAACCDTPHPTALSELGSVPDSDSAEAPVNRPSEISRSEPVQALGELRALALAQAAERLARRDPAAWDSIRSGWARAAWSQNAIVCPARGPSAARSGRRASTVTASNAAVLPRPRSSDRGRPGEIWHPSARSARIGRGRSGSRVLVD